MKAKFVIVTSMILTAISASATPTLLTGVPANSYLAEPTGASPSLGTLFTFDSLTPNSTFNPAQYSAQGLSIASPDGLIVAPFSTQSAPNELFDNSTNGTADITITTDVTNKIGLGIADSDGVTIMLQALSASGADFGSPFSVTLPSSGSNPGNGYFVISDTTKDIYGLHVLQDAANASYSGLAIDDVQFAAAPEPASFALLGIATVALGMVRLRKRF